MPYDTDTAEEVKNSLLGRASSKISFLIKGGRCPFTHYSYCFSDCGHTHTNTHTFPAWCYLYRGYGAWEQSRQWRKAETASSGEAWDLVIIEPNQEPSCYMKGGTYLLIGYCTTCGWEHSHMNYKALLRHVLQGLPLRGAFPGSQITRVCNLE